MKKTGLVLVLAIMFAIAPNISNANTHTVDYAGLIAQLQAQVEQLRAELEARNDVGFVLSADNMNCVDLQNNMRRGAHDRWTNGEVSILQNFLKNNPESRWPSRQRVTGYYGRLTAQSVTNFQLANGLISSTYSRGAGSVGPITREAIKAMTCDQVPDQMQNYSLSTDTDKSAYTFGENIRVNTVVTNDSNVILPVTFSNGCETTVELVNISSGSTYVPFNDTCTQNIVETSVNHNSSRTWFDMSYLLNDSLLPAGTYKAVVSVGSLGEVESDTFTIADAPTNNTPVVAYLNSNFSLNEDQRATLINTSYRFTYKQDTIYCVTTPCPQPDPRIVVSNSTNNFYKEINLGVGETKSVTGTNYNIQLKSRSFDTSINEFVVTLLITADQANTTIPNITSVSPASAHVGDVVTVTASNLSIYNNTIILRALTPEANFWSKRITGLVGISGSLTFTVPQDAPVGDYYIDIENQYGLSEGYPFMVTNPVPDPATAVSLSAVPSSGNAPLTVTFNVTATDIPSCTGSSWNYGDGNVEAVTPGCIPGPTTYNSFTDSRTHTYNEPGTYEVSASYGPAGDTVTVNVSGGSFALGDVNMDGQVDILDTAVIRYYVLGYDGYTDLSDMQMELADVDDNGAVDNNDYLLLVEVTKWFVEDQLPARFGDMNGDLVINLSDSVIANRIVEGVQTATDLQKSLLDVDLDGDRDLQDVQYIVSAAAGNITLPVTDNSTDVLRGDVNLDGRISLADVIIAARYVSGTETLTSEQIQAADLNGDGVVTDWDVVNINRILLGLPEVDFLLGDVNLDGEIDVADALLALRHAEGIQTLNTAGRLSADIDSNGVVNVLDVSNILRLAVGLDVENFMIGDVSGPNGQRDGVVDIYDVIKVNRIVAGLDTADDLTRFLADVTLNGVLNSNDVTQLSRMAVGYDVVYD